MSVANVFHARAGNLHPLMLHSDREPGAYERAGLAGDILVPCIRYDGFIRKGVER